MKEIVIIGVLIFGGFIGKGISNNKGHNNGMLLIISGIVVGVVSMSICKTIFGIMFAIFLYYIVVLVYASSLPDLKSREWKDAKNNFPSISGNYYCIIKGSNKVEKCYYDKNDGIWKSTFEIEKWS